MTPTTAPTCPAKRTGQAPLIVIDYIGLLAPDRTGRRAENHYAEMTDKWRQRAATDWTAYLKARTTAQERKRDMPAPPPVNPADGPPAIG
ncbi:hypothetical protein ACIHEI_35115 [Kitasatospora sp. NPDC051984]|uniref:hypothetical protein n=1 Tax=Kitasatospora sp. NPDC051984 TaxID=3364059 RepID=UPI0037C85E91